MAVGRGVLFVAQLAGGRGGCLTEGGDIEELWILWQLVLKFKQLDLLGHVDQLILTQGQQLLHQGLLFSSPRNQLPDEIAEQFILGCQFTEQLLLLEELLLSALLELHSQSELHEDLADTLPHSELTVIDAFLTGMQVVVVDARGACRGQEDSIQPQRRPYLSQL
jgi:hypothetical protein